MTWTPASTASRSTRMARPRSGDRPRSAPSDAHRPEAESADLDVPEQDGLCWHDAQPTFRTRLAGKLLASPAELATSARYGVSPTWLVGHATLLRGPSLPRRVAPPEIIERIGALPQHEQPGVRWLAASNWHVTLRFFGEADEDEVAARLEHRAGCGAPRSDLPSRDSATVSSSFPSTASMHWRVPSWT